MLTFYVATLAAGLAILVAQLAAGHDADAAGHDLHHAGGDHDAAPWSVLASLRFWAFALLAFGLVGTLLHAFGLAGFAVTLSLAIASGLGSGFFAVTVLRRLIAKSPTSNVSQVDVVGRVARVIVAVDPNAAGKVRVEMKGAWIDLVARAPEALAVGEAVIVVEVAGSEARVARAPKELAP